MNSTSIFRYCAGMHHHHQHDCVLHFCNLLLIRWGNQKERRLKFIFNKIACWFRQYNRLHRGCSEALPEAYPSVSCPQRTGGTGKHRELLQIMASCVETGHVDRITRLVSLRPLNPSLEKPSRSEWGETQTKCISVFFHYLPRPSGAHKHWRLIMR